MSSHSTVYMFGDQAAFSKNTLRALLRLNQDPVLKSFLGQAGSTLRREIQALPWKQREQFPAFVSLSDLLAVDAEKELHPAIRLALTTISHIAIYILERGHALQNSLRDGAQYVAGFGSGVLAAVAASCFPQREVMAATAGQEIIAVSFRTGLRAANSKTEVGSTVQQSGSWRVRIDTEDARHIEELLAEYCSSQSVLPWMRPYINGISKTSVFLAGCPHVLDKFVEVNHLTTVSCSVNAPYHASHLFSSSDVTLIVDTVSPDLLGVESRSKVLMPRNDDKAPTLYTMLHFAIDKILRQRTEGMPIMAQIMQTVKTAPDGICTVVAVGTDNDKGLAVLLSPLCRFMTAESLLKELPLSGGTDQPKLAITGFSGRYPNAQNLEAFWDVLHRGVDTHSEVPSNRWDIKTHVDPAGKRKNTSATPFGCWLDEPGLFDRSFFSISPREAPQMDPAQRLALMCAYEAVEMSGIVPDATPSTAKSRVGVFIGCTSNDWCETNSPQDIDFYFIPGGNRAFIPGRINYFFKFSGPSYAIDTACSSSLAAIHLACNALWRGEIDTAIVGGTNVLTNPDVTAGLDRGHFLSRTGNCKSFDDDADGYCRGEGVGILVLKRLEDAQAENDTIYASILSAATNHSAEAESITRPHVGAQQALFSQVLANAGLQPNDIGYVEMHGTGTQAGDSREMTSVSQTFAPWPAGDPRGRDNDLFVGSVKANVGHGEAVSGVTAVTKILLMLQKNEIVPHCGIKNRINSTFPTDLEQRRVKIARQSVAWLPTEKPRRILVNNFSAAGGNSCVLLEEAPRRPKRTTLEFYDKRPAQVITVSAKTKTALEANLHSMARFLQTTHSIPLSDIAYTATARRLHYNFRASFVAQSVQEMRKLVSQEATSPPKQFSGPPKMIFAFAGQGSNHAGMAGSLYDSYSLFRAEVDRLDAIVRSQGFNTVLPYLRGTNDTEQEASPLVCQLSHICLQIGLSKLWKSWGIAPSAVVGHSLGEYAALTCAGVLSDYEAIWLCGNRARLLAAHCQIGTHSMLAVRCSREEALTHTKGLLVEVACINGPQETVLSGTKDSLQPAIERLQAADLKTNRVQLPYAFHSSQVQTILPQLSSLVDQIAIKPTTVPIISPLLSTVLNVGQSIEPEYLVRQCREAVNLLGAVEAGRAAGILNDRAHLLELGPGLILSRLVKRTLGPSSPAALIPSLDATKDSSLVLASSVATAYRIGCNVDWMQYHRDYEHAVVRLPSYSWDLKTYWMQYVHDWSLRKGDPLPVGGKPQIEFSTTSCHRVISADTKGDTLQLKVESDLQAPELKPVVSGHTVNGVAVCIGSVYADIAKACGAALLMHFQPGTTSTVVTVNEVDMQESITISEKPGPQMIDIEASCNWQQKKAVITISSAGKTNATAVVRFAEKKDQQATLERSVSGSAELIRAVKDAAADGQADRFTRSMAYRMVASLAHYDESHQGVQECYLHSENLEATSVVATQPRHRLAGTFALHPCVFDSILQLATFVMNANEYARFDQEVYVVRGWDTAFINETLSTEKSYEAYVKMSARDKDMAAGDIAILSQGIVIGSIKGVRVQRVPRRLMDVMFRSKAVSAPAPPSQPVTNGTSAPKSDTSSSVQLIGKALSIVADESGIPLAELKDDQELADIGIDSLLILVIISRFRDELSLDLPPTFFMEISSIGALKKYLGGKDEPQADEDPSLNAENASLQNGSGATNSTNDVHSTNGINGTNGHNGRNDDHGSNGVKKAAAKKTTSAILQGTPKKALKTMFLFPDGSGSATSYMSLPYIDKQIALVGINCPYMKNPQDMVSGIEEIAAILLTEVRRHQPHGPYYLGGWSAGGAFAYCAAQMLLAEGEEVGGLVLIDAPCPIGLGKLPQIFFDFWKTIHQPGGPVADKPIPDWVMDHFQAVNANLRGYVAEPFAPGRSPKTYMAWAAQGTDNLAGFKDRHLLTKEESEDLGFLMDDKTDFGPRGWDRLLDGDLMIETAMTSNHFTIVRGDGAQLVSGMIKRACFA